MGPDMLLPIFLTEDAVDRRRRPRLRLNYPLRLYRPGQAIRIDTRTENISCEGFFCITGCAFAPGEMLECELVIPNDELGQPPERDMILRCRAEVVRVVAIEGKTAFGVACRLADYTIGPLTVERDQPAACSS